METGSPDKNSMEIGYSFWNWVEKLTVPLNSSINDTTPFFDWDVRVHQLAIELYTIDANGVYTRILANTASSDLIRLDMWDSSTQKELFSNVPLDVWTVQALGQSINFRGFTISKQRAVKFTAYHTRVNWTTGSIELHVILSGQRVM
jgi:hypothetical protein